MKFCFATTDTVLPADFIGVGFSEVNPCFLHHHTGVSPQKVWTHNSLRLQLFTARLLHVCKIQRRGPWVRDLLGFSVCVEILVFLGRQAAPAHLPCCANRRSQCHRLVSRECTHTRVYSWCGCVGIPTLSKDALGLFTVFAKEFQDHAR